MMKGQAGLLNEIGIYVIKGSLRRSFLYDREFRFKRSF